ASDTKRQRSGKRAHERTAQRNVDHPADKSRSFRRVADSSAAVDALFVVSVAGAFWDRSHREIRRPAGGISLENHNYLSADLDADGRNLSATGSVGVLLDWAPDTQPDSRDDDSLFSGGGLVLRCAGAGELPRPDVCDAITLGASLE